MKKSVLFFVCLLVFLFPSQVIGQKKVPILLYHLIGEYHGEGSEELYVSPKNFEEQMIYLKDHGFTLLTMDRWAEINKVKNPIFITFDDGYKNNLNAFSIFQKLKDQRFKPTGTIFVISDFIGRPNRLSEADLKKMVDSGLISIQSHTATHPDLTKITNYQYELKESRDKIQNIIGRPVTALAYPYGSFNDRVIAETKKYYLFGFTTIPEPFAQQGLKDERYLLPRIYVKHSTSLHEFAKIVGGD